MEGFCRVKAAKGMTRRDLILHKTEIWKINGHCKCGVDTLMRQEREVSLGYVLEPPQRRGPAVRGFVKMPRICPKLRQGNDR